jgi:thymidylate synthase
VGTVSLFGEYLKFDISRTVPVLTTKRIPWKSAIKELLWFMRGDTDSKKLSAEGVKVWEANTTREFLDNRGLHNYPEGDVGALYPWQFRHFGAPYINCETPSAEKGFDQIAYVLDLLKNDPFSRRICMSTWNASQISQMVLPPCHGSFIAFYVEENNGIKYLSCHVTNRSQDMGLGVAWNIIHYTVLTYIFAKKCGMSPKELTISIGDGHVYSNHVEALKLQLQRTPRVAPALHLSDSIIEKDFEDITIEDFELVGYFPHPSISMPMAV